MKIITIQYISLSANALLRYTCGLFDLLSDERPPVIILVSWVASEVTALYAFNYFLVMSRAFFSRPIPRNMNFLFYQLLSPGSES